jgi:hypothetical protein
VLAVLERTGWKAIRTSEPHRTLRRQSWPGLQSTRVLCRKTCGMPGRSDQSLPDLSRPRITLPIPQQLPGHPRRRAEARQGPWISVAGGIDQEFVRHHLRRAGRQIIGSWFHLPPALLDKGGQLRQHVIHDEIRRFLDEPATARLQIENARLVAQDHALRIRSGSAEGNGVTGAAGKISPWVIGQTSGVSRLLKTFGETIRTKRIPPVRGLIWGSD